jgi:hypothetical protein
VATAAACPNQQIPAFDGPLPLTQPLIAVRAFVDPCAVVQAQMVTPASVYEVSRNQAIQEAKAVRDSIGQAAVGAAGRREVHPAPSAENAVKKPGRPPLLTVGQLPRAPPPRTDPTGDS